MRRGIFGRSLAFEAGGEPIVNALAKTSSTDPYLEVSIHLPNQVGDWYNVRSLGGPMALKWLILHRDGHPNTTAVWCVLYTFQGYIYQ